MFDDPKVQVVFKKYEERREADARRMRELGPESIHHRDEFLLPIGPDVGRFVHALILAKRPRTILEVGTSYGYSTIFLADAARSVGARVVTLEIADHKQAYARDQLIAAGLENVVDFRLGDAVQTITLAEDIFDLALIDIWKELYLPAFDALYNKLSEEAVIIADNMIEPQSARDDVRKYRAAVKNKSDFQTALLPIGSGIELSVKLTAGSNLL
ncbi:MAG: class I SAM-dependent methyltransferase [Parvularculaceae bacterium]|nr:class I SAM-dependent methyltransferase [Parvularculaceae bacterium]